MTSFTLTIQTPHAVLDRPHHPRAPLRGLPELLAVIIPIFGFDKRFRRVNRVTRRAIQLTAAGSVLILASGCGNRVNTPRELAGAVTYTINVTGTATSLTGTALQHSTAVTLQVL